MTGWKACPLRFLDFQDLIRCFDPVRLPFIRGRPAPFFGAERGSFVSVPSEVRDYEFSG